MWATLKELARDTLGSSGYDVLAQLYWRLLSMVGAPFSGGNRLYWVNLVAFLAVAAIAYLISRRRGFTLRGFLRHSFPGAVYLHKSAILDYKIYAMNALLAPTQLVFRSFGTATVATATAGSLAAMLGEDAELTEPGVALLIAFTVFTAIVEDFASYAIHALHHRVPILWETHKLHHSAEVLTPLTNFRIHPLYTIAQYAMGALFVGLLQGLFLHVFSLEATLLTLFGVNVVTALFNLLSNLRHSHIWISFGPILSHIFVSPAQHQIHHSVAPEHKDKNYGLVFAFWDWIFGTLYVPRQREELTFGLGDGQPQPHTNLVSAYLGPIVGIWRHLRNGATALSNERGVNRTDIS